MARHARSVTNPKTIEPRANRVKKIENVSISPAATSLLHPGHGITRNHASNGFGASISHVTKMAPVAPDARAAKTSRPGINVSPLTN
jgi:hypothetical protein